MFARRILDCWKTNCSDWRWMALACVVLAISACAPLHAQFSYTDVYDFDCLPGDCQPYDYGQLTLGLDGNLYGTTYGAGANGFGTVFVVTPSGSSYTDLVQFDGTTNGKFPFGGLTRVGADFYGTTQNGGTFGFGTLFRFTPPSSFTVLHYFNGTDGEYPETPPTQGKDGNLYGVTGSGTTYRVRLPKGTFQQLSGNTGGAVLNPLFPAPDGYLYGASYNFDTTAGTVFRMTTGGSIKVIHSFTAADGTPAGVIMGADGNLYGTTKFGTFGGPNFNGNVFQLTLKNKLTPLYDFTPVHGADINDDGAQPLANLLADPDGIHFYGSTTIGGVCGVGTLFEITKGGTFNKLFDFSPEPLLTCNSPGVTGAVSYATLMPYTNGLMYGVTAGGGSSNNGVVFTLTPETIHLTVIAGPVWVKPGDAVEILGNNMNEVINVGFAGVQAQFRFDSDTYLTATVPNAAVDGLITVTLATGEQIESQQSMHILPVITNLDPPGGPVGTQVGIVGGGFLGTKKVTFGGVKSTNFTVVTPTLIQAIVPTGAKTGKVHVTTPDGTATSKQTFTVQ